MRRIAWPINRDMRDAIGNAFGYVAAGTALSETVARLGVEIDDDAPTEVHFVNPMGLRPRPGRFVVLFTMFEHAELPEYFDRGFLRADLAIVPSRYCRSIFTPLSRKTGTPLDLVPLGFDPARFPFHPRSMPRAGDPFTFLHVGAPNGRKGIVPVIRAWDRYFGGCKDVHLFVKTTTPGDARLERVSHNVTFDSRRYTDAEMTDLYHRAHCLVWPTGGEGFGLPALEAMATGLPIITVKHSSHPEFLQDAAYYARHTMTWTTDGFKHWIRGADVHIDDLALRMIEVRERYPVALAKAARGALRAHKSWTWDHAARRLVDVLDRHVPDSMWG